MIWFIVGFLSALGLSIWIAMSDGLKTFGDIFDIGTVMVIGTLAGPVTTVFAISLVYDEYKDTKLPWAK